MTNPETAQNRLAQVLDHAIFVSLLVMIALTAVPYGTVEPWWVAFFECTIFAIGVLWIIEGLLAGRWLVKEHRLLVPLLALTVFAFLQTLPLPSASVEAAAGIQGKVWQALSADPYETRLAALKILALTLTGALLLRYISNERRLRALIYVVIGIGAASALFGILRQTTQHETGFMLPLLKLNSGYGQFINRDHFAYLMEMAFGLVLGLTIGGGVRRDRLLIYIAVALPIWTALVLANSRGGIFSMLGQVLFLALLVNVGRRSQESLAQGSGALPLLRRITSSLIFRLALTACLVTAMFAGAIWMGGEPLISHLEAVPGEISAEGAEGSEGTRRLEIWHATWQLIKANPIAGVGFGGYRVAFPAYHNASGKSKPQQAHNDYLELQASGGLIGTALAAWFITSFIKRARARLLRLIDPFRRAACLGALVGLFGVAVHSLVDFGLHTTINALVFASLIVIATVDIRNPDKTSQSSDAGQHRLRP